MTRLFFFSVLLSLMCARLPNADAHYDLSTPLGLEETGIFKVLCMKNGNTVLFHLQNNKSINIKVFDSSHKKIADKKHICDLLDINTLSTSLFKGLFEVNGEAVIFFEQENLGRHSLLRLCFDATNGTLTAEDQVGRSRGLAKPTRFFVINRDKEPGYAVFFCEDVPQFRRSAAKVVFFNSRHEVVETVPLKFDRDKYDYLDVVGAESLSQGVLITLSLSNMVLNGTGSNIATAPVCNYSLYSFFIPSGTSQVQAKQINLQSRVVPFYTLCSYNSFASKINVLMTSFRDATYQNGIDNQPLGIISNLLLRMDKNSMELSYNWFTNELANNIYQEKTDTGAKFSGFPLRMFTNSNGLSTVVSQSYNRYANSENYVRSAVHETYLGNICVTQFDDDGKELWGTVLPLSQYFKSYRQYYDPLNLAKRWQGHALFNDLPPQVYERQFMSANVYHSGYDHYIIFNDGNNNFNNSIEAPGDTVFTSTLSNAVYYKVNRKKEVSKHYLLGEPLDREYKTSFIEGADFDEQRKTYATMIRYKRGNYVSLRMAWVQLD